MAGCQNRWKKNKEKLKEDLKIALHEISKDRYMIYLNDATAFMDRINELPESLRKGSNRVHLIQEIFKRENNSAVDNPRGVLDDFLSGRLNQVIFNGSHSAVYNPRVIRALLWTFTAAGRKFPDSKTLELALRTGLKLSLIHI